MLDIGAGPGMVDFLACRFGARKVYAVEPSDAIFVAQKMARGQWSRRSNRFYPRGLYRHQPSAEGRCDRSGQPGVLPLFQTNLSSMADARRRLLSDGGVLIPQRDSLWAAVVEAPETHGRIVAPWTENRFDLTMDAARQVATNTVGKRRFSSANSSCPSRGAGARSTTRLSGISGSASTTNSGFTARMAHGLVVWFDSILADGVGFSNAPGEKELIYGSGFFPWTVPVALEAGDAVAIQLANLIGGDYVDLGSQGVSGRCCAPDGALSAIDMGAPISTKRLRRRASGYRPKLGTDGEIERLILSRVDGTSSNLEIARLLVQRFPARFKSLIEALTRVGELSDRYADDETETKFARSI